MSYPIEPDEDIEYVRRERDELRARCEAGAKAWDELQTEMAKVRQISDHNAQALARALMQLWELRGQKDQ